MCGEGKWSTVHQACVALAGPSWLWCWALPFFCSPPLPLPPPPQNVCLLNSFAAFASMASFGSTFHMVPACCPPQPQHDGQHVLDPLLPSWPGAICALCSLSNGVPIQHHEPTNRTCSFFSTRSGWGTDTRRDCAAAMLTGIDSDAKGLLITYKGLLNPLGLWRLAQVTGATLGTKQHSVSFRAPRLSCWALLVGAQGQWQRAHLLPPQVHCTLSTAV